MSSMRVCSSPISQEMPGALESDARASWGAACCAPTEAVRVATDVADPLRETHGINDGRFNGEKMGLLFASE
jgi:hypothetical protein